MSVGTPKGPLEGLGSGSHTKRGAKTKPILSLLCVLASLVACDIPTELPEWDQRWILPADEARVGVDEVLPDGVALSADQSAFEVTVDPISIQTSLGDLCAPCLALDGITTAKPPFQGSLRQLADLPAEVERADVAEGRVLVQARNGLSFDPIRPASGSTGTITLSLYSGSEEGGLLDRAVADGSTEAFPSGSTLSRTMEFSGEVDGALLVLLEIHSPLGDPITVDVTESVSLEAEVLSLKLSSVEADLSGQAFTMEDTDLELDDLDEDMVERIQEGALEFEVQNPWAVGATFLITIAGPFDHIHKAFSIEGAPVSRGRVEFSGGELRTFLGKEGVVLSGSGTVDQHAGQVSLSPGQILVLETTLDLFIRIGGGGNKS